MLAAACPAKEGESVLDLGCGVGGAGFCVLRRVVDTKLTGIDIQADHIEMAQENILLNDMQGRAEFFCADVRKYKGGLFNHVICNPPYLDAGTHMPSPSKQKATALYHGEKDISVVDWVDTGFAHLKAWGSFTMIHRADHVDKIIQALGKRFGAAEIIPLWPRSGEMAKRVIVRALKDRKTPAQLHAGITLHEADGSYTPEADAILRGTLAISGT